jgi:hypothetical protein
MENVSRNLAVPAEMPVLATLLPTRGISTNVDVSHD